MSALHRTKSGVFEIKNAIPFSLLQQDPPAEELEKFLIPTESVLPFPMLSITDKNPERIFNGMAVETDATDGLYKLYKDERFYGIAQVQNGKAKAKTKLC